MTTQRPVSRNIESAVVDVIIAAWNSASTIERAITSVMNDPAVLSVIVVDDGSSDDTASRADALAFGNDRIRVFRCDSNRGPSAARNLALKHATAPWVTPLDSDDFIQPGRFETLLANCQQYDFVADDPIQLDVNAAPNCAGEAMLQVDAASPDLTLATFVRANIGRRGVLRREMGFLKPLMRRDFLERHGLCYNEAVRLGEDYVLYTLALASGARFRLLPAAGYVAVLRNTSLSAHHARVDLEALRVADKSLLRLPGLARRERAALRAHLRFQEGKIQWLELIDAVKSRDILRAIRSFTLSPPVAASVARNLVGEGVRRLGVQTKRYVSLA